MRVVACLVARKWVIRILEVSVADVSVASHCAGEKGEAVSLVVFAQKLVSCCGSGPSG